MVSAGAYNPTFVLHPGSGEAGSDVVRDDVAFDATSLTLDGEGGFTAVGTLRGHFGANPESDSDEPAEATIEAYARGGSVQLIQLVVAHDGDVRFLATFAPDASREGEFAGTAFLSRLGERPDGQP